MSVLRHRNQFWVHVLLILAAILVIFPVYIAIIASTHSAQELLHAPIPILPGHYFWENYRVVLTNGLAANGGEPILPMMLNSLIMALLIAFGKISVSIISAYAVVYFKFPCRLVFFWMIFLTLMLPVEVRILPTFEVVASLNMLNSYAGLSLPLIASATATFLFRQFFMTIPDQLTEAARIDGAGPIRFFIDIILPLSRTNIVALFVIMFIYGWNQYLWPLVITTKGSMYTAVMGIQRLANVADQIPQWNYVMATAVLAMLPPIFVVLVMQWWFVKGLVDTEK